MKLRTAFIASLIALSAAAALLAAGGDDGKHWWSYLEALANDQMEGRNTGSEAHRRAAQYVATQFEQDGLKPAGVQGYIQPVKFDARKIVEPASSLALVHNGKAEQLVLGEDAVIGLRTDPADAVEAPLVFAGYGLTVPEMHYDDLAGLDLRGRIIVTLSGSRPSNIPGPLNSHYSTPAERGRFLRDAGVIGTVTIANPHTADIPWSRSSLARFQEAMSLVDPALQDGGGLKIAVTANAAHADKWLAGTGHTIDELLALADAGKPLPRFPLNAGLRAKVKVERRKLESQNIIAAWPGSDRVLKSEYVVFSAHVDHVGIGEPINGDRIYNGAMDNASGVASLLDIARTLRETNVKTRRSLLFVVVTGEEKGLLGSRYFAAHPTVDRKSMVADLNIDMFLPIYPLRILTVHGLKESDLGDVARRVAQSLSVEVQEDLQPERNVFIRSDQYNFIRRGIPALKMDVGFAKGSKEAAMQKDWLTNRYHAPSDDLNQPVDLKAAADYNRILLKLAETVADDPARPQWKADSFFRRFAE